MLELHKEVFKNDALQKAAWDGDLDEVKRLIETDIDVNLKNESDDTALHDAVHKGHEEIIQILLDNGASTKEKNYYGQTAMDIAKAGGDSHHPLADVGVINILEKHEEKRIAALTKN